MAPTNRCLEILRVSRIGSMREATRLAVWVWVRWVLSCLTEEFPTLSAVIGRAERDAIISIVALAPHVMIAECGKYTTAGQLEEICVVDVMCVRWAGGNRTEYSPGTAGIGARQGLDCVVVALEIGGGTEKRAIICDNCPTVCISTSHGANQSGGFG